MSGSVKTAERLFAAYAGESALVLDALERDGYANYVDTFLRPLVAEGRDRPADAADATLRINAALYSVVEDLRSGRLSEADYVEPAQIYELSRERLDQSTAVLKDRMARMQADPLWPQELGPERAGDLWSRSLISVLAPQKASQILENEPLWQAMRAHALEAPDEARLLIAAELFHGEAELRPMAGAALPAMVEAARIDPLRSVSELPASLELSILRGLQRDREIDGFLEPVAGRGYLVYSMKSPEEVASEISSKLQNHQLEHLSPQARSALLSLLGPPSSPGSALAARMKSESSDREWRELGGEVLELAALGFASGGTAGIAAAALHGARASSTAVRVAKFVTASATFTTLGSLGEELTAGRFAKDALALGVLSRAAKLAPLVAKLIPADSMGSAFTKFAAQHGAAVGVSSAVLTTFAATENILAGQGIDREELGRIFVDQLKLVGALHAVNSAVSARLPTKRHAAKLDEVVAALERGQSERAAKLIFELEIAGKELSQGLERELLRRGAEAGATAAELEAYGAAIRGRPVDEIVKLSTSTGVPQYWTHSCVAAVLQTALARTNPVYAYRLNTDRAFAAREQRAILEANEGVASTNIHAGRGIEPHRAVSPAALERALGVPYELRVSAEYAREAKGAAELSRFTDKSSAYALIESAARRGQPVLFSAATPLGTHEMLVVGVEGRGAAAKLLIFDPATKQVSPVELRLAELIYSPQTIHLPRL